MEEKSRAKAQQIISEAERKQKDMERETRLECDELLRKAQAESQQYWDDVSSRLEAFYNTHAGLRELLSIVTPLEKQE